MTLLNGWVKEVGDIHLSKFRGQMEIGIKQSHSDLVTEIDTKSEAYLVAKIEHHFPHHNILGEETGEHLHNSPWRWVIDPVDGTSNYSQGLPMFTVSVALQYNDESVVGAVYAPYLKELFTAIKGEGAFLNGSPIRVSDKKELKYCLVSTGFPVDKATNPDNNGDNTLRMLPNIRCLRRFGGAALDLCYTAAGFLDGFWELNINIWDVAAGVLILEEAGGKVDYLRKDGSRKLCPVAANPTILPQMMALLK